MAAILRHDRTLRRFFIAHAQSQLGNGAAYVALLILAYDRLHAGWAISLVLLGEFLPGIFLTPYFGALADRLPRRNLAVAGDLIRAGAFTGLALVPSYASTVGFALLAGVGAALFRPPISAALPQLVPESCRSQATALFWACVNAGVMVGPLISAGLLLVTSPRVILLANAATFLASSALLCTIDLGRARAVEPANGERPLRGQTLAGVQAAARIAGLPVLLVAGALIVLAGAMFNVAAPVLATGPLRGGGSGYAALYVAYGAGLLGGSLVTARAGSALASLRRIFLVGIIVNGLALVVMGVLNSFLLAFVAFAFVGFGEALLIGPEMRLVQELVADHLLGRVFGFKDVLENIAFVGAFLGAGAIIAIAGPRPVFVSSGLALLVIAAGTARCFEAGVSRAEPEVYAAT